MKDVMRVNSRELSDGQKQRAEMIKEKGNGFYDYLDKLPQSWEMRVAKQKLEEAVMWAVKGITA